MTIIETFTALDWHDATLLKLSINRSNAGQDDIVSLKIRWSNNSESIVNFHDCYFLDAQMNFGIIAEKFLVPKVSFGMHMITKKILH